MKKDYAKQEFLLTKRQKEIYDAIVKNPYITYRGLCDIFKISQGGMQSIIQAIAKKGFIDEYKQIVWVVLKTDAETLKTKVDKGATQKKKR